MIDRQLASLSDDKLVAPAEAPPRGQAPAQGPTPVPRGAAPVAPATQGARPAVGGMPATIAPPRTWRTRAALAGQLLVAVGLAAAATPGLWPYGWRCGSELVIYLAVAGAALLAGLLAARTTWRHRAGFSHVLSLGAVLWALTLVTWQVLPRTGVVVPTERVAVPAVWACQ